MPPLQHQNANLAIPAQDEAELLALHFSNVFKPQSILPDISHLDQVNKFITSPLPMALSAKYTTPDKISSIAKTLNANKSPGHDQQHAFKMVFHVKNKKLTNLNLHTSLSLSDQRTVLKFFSTVQ